MIHHGLAGQRQAEAEAGLLARGDEGLEEPAADLSESRHNNALAEGARAPGMMVYRRMLMAAAPSPNCANTWAQSFYPLRNVVLLICFGTKMVSPGLRRRSWNFGARGSTDQDSLSTEPSARIRKV